jgi:hypothetical protein
VTLTAIKIISHYSYEDRNRSHHMEPTLKKMEGLIKNWQYRNTGILEHTKPQTKTNITKTNKKIISNTDPKHREK